MQIINRIFKHNNTDVFDLNVFSSYESNDYHFDSAILPFWTYKNFMIEADKLYTKSYRFNQDYFDDLANQISKEIINLKDATSYFFPTFFLDDLGKVKTECLDKYSAIKQKIAYKRADYIGATNQYGLHYLRTILVEFNNQTEDSKYITCNSITKEEFEKKLTNERAISNYIDNLPSAISFIQFNSSCFKPSFFACLDENLNISFAVLDYSKSILA